MTYTVLDNNLPANCYNFDVCPTLKQNEFDSFQKACIYALKWIYGFSTQDAELELKSVRINLDELINDSVKIVEVNDTKSVDVPVEFEQVTFKRF